jgi:hypothetical protein
MTKDNFLNSKKKRNITDGSPSNPYRSLSKNSHMKNAHFKKLTELEKKQLEMLGMIHRLKHKARILGDLRNVSNEILSNCAYHEKNIEEQSKRIEKLNVPQEEKDIIRDIWELKQQMGKSLMNDAKELITYVKNNK